MPEQVKNIIEDFRRGQPVLLIDDVDPEHTAYIVAASSSITTEDVCLMINAGRAVICVAISEEKIKSLALPMMPAKNGQLSEDMTVSIEARKGVTTGISAADRARTLRTLARTKDSKLDLVMPGHIFPVRAIKGGVLVRPNIAEAAHDLAVVSSLEPVVAYCQCLSESGEIMTGKDLPALAEELCLRSVSISDLIRFRLASESIVEKIAEARLPTQIAGEFKAVSFRSLTDDAEHLALIKGDLGNIASSEPVLVRVQAEQLVGDLLGTGEASSRQTINAALKKIQEKGRGVFIYVKHPRKGVVKRHVDSLSKAPTSPSSNANLREIGVGAQILSALGAKKISLITNSTRDIPGIEAFDIEIVDRVRFRTEL
ncbi:hypothetical protein BVY02_01925 [bacterium J17]|nr:hypothetical protein BVY02_01925 [bacterium J17]